MLKKTELSPHALYINVKAFWPSPVKFSVSSDAPICNASVAKSSTPSTDLNSDTPCPTFFSAFSFKLMAALTSLMCSAPHSGQIQLLIARFFVIGFLKPQQWQIWLEAKNLSALITWQLFSFRDDFHNSLFVKFPQLASP